MNSHHSHQTPESGFALISVLALVSLAALTATAFLASARLERQATRSIGDTTRLQMTLNAGRECATEILNNVGEPRWNFVTTYWRTNIADELGYLFIGKPGSINSLNWYYYCGFSPATWTDLGTNNIENFIIVTNTSCQGSFSNDIASYMSNATKGFTNPLSPTNKLCTAIPMVGNRISPPVGWVYIKQDVRTNPTTTNTTNLPVARFAYFIEDLGGLIDAERMGASTNRLSGTNPEEISISNLKGVTISKLAEYTNKRPQYLTPGMLMAVNGGILTNTNDLRYFASRLRACKWDGNSSTTNWDRVPMVPISSGPAGYFYPTNCGNLKMNLNTNLDAAGCVRIADFLKSFRSGNKGTNLIFTNHAGGMIGTNYLYALAANIVDYADTDSLPTTLNGIPIAGFDAYPIPTIIFDRLSLDSTGTILNVDCYWQFWNLSTATSSIVSYDYSYDFADTLGSWGTNIVSAAYPANRLSTAPWTGTISIPKLTPGSCYITNVISTNLNLTNLMKTYVKGTTVNNIWINGTGTGFITTNNSLTLKIKGSAQPFFRLNMGYERKAKTLDNSGTPKWSGGCPGLRYDNVSKGVPPLGDPRMTLYLTNTNANGYLSATDYNENIEWQLGYAQTRNAVYPPAPAAGGKPYTGNPGYWPDASNTFTSLTLGSPFPDATAPIRGIFSALNIPSAKLSTNTNGLFTNICQLGNIFDPMQWVSTDITNQILWVDCDIGATNDPLGKTWTNNTMYGGGQTLRIGRAEHTRFAFTNLGGDYPVPSLGTSAAGLLDLFCTTNTYDWAGRININTAPPSVLAALAGGITLSKDPNMKPTTGPANATMVSAFTNGVMKFRSLYPFITPSQLAFISTNYGASAWTNTAAWQLGAVFSPRYGGLQGVTSLNDEAREEWFSKIYALTAVQSFNYRIYVVAQLLNTNGLPKGAMMRKYYQVYLNNNTPTSVDSTTGQKINPDNQPPSVSPVVIYEATY